MKSGMSYFTGVVCLAFLVPGVSGAAASFGFQSVVQIAQKLAETAYEPPSAVPEFLGKLSYDQYRKIRFQPKYNLWHQSHTDFQVMLIAPGQNYRYPVEINVVDASGVHSVGFHKAWFTWPGKLASKVPDGLGYAGFKLTYPLNAPDLQNQFLVFAGASYFRGVARNQRFGLSARGIAVDTGLSSGEEFPRFTKFWLVRPSPDAEAMKLYALLNGPSLTGAYQFVVFPGAPTRVEIRAQLFVRQHIKLLGLAPLTSMFFYGTNTPRPEGTWRSAVHDSDGLLVHSSTGEWLWRPLRDPVALRHDYLTANSPKGFGLLQRETRFFAYEDAEARYDRRPSAWVETHGDWGKGHVVLVQIPTSSEANDNIVAFWSPAQEPAAGDKLKLRYSLLFGWPDIPQEPLAHVASTLVGKADPGDGQTPAGAYRMVVDFAGGPLTQLNQGAAVEAVVTGLDGTQILGQAVHAIKSPELWRVSMLVEPAKDKAARVRAYLKQGDKTLSETWSYSLPADNRFTSDD